MDINKEARRCNSIAADCFLKARVLVGSCSRLTDVFTSKVDNVKRDQYIRKETYKATYAPPGLVKNTLFVGCCSRVTHVCSVEVECNMSKKPICRKRDLHRDLKRPTCRLFFQEASVRRSCSQLTDVCNVELVKIYKESYGETYTQRST